MTPTPLQIYKLMPSLGMDVYSAFESLETCNINTPLRLAHFFSQIGHESAGGKFLVENLNYSRDSLLRVFRKYFTEEQAAQYARKPDKIASRVYANRMGNGSEASGDGWKFRGRGFIQITGRYNYSVCSEYIFGDDTLLKNPDLLIDIRYACDSACWYWDTNRLNRFCDSDDIIRLTKAINGGLNGLDDRKLRLETAKRVFGV